MRQPRPRDPPSGFAVVQGVRTANAAVELDDGSILAAIDGGSMVHVNPDGTLDRAYPVMGSSIRTVASWNGHFTSAGNLPSGHPFIACY